LNDRIIYVALVLLALLGLVSFWVAPQYEKGVWIALVAASNALSAALGAKFGLAQAQSNLPIPAITDEIGPKPLK